MNKHLIVVLAVLLMMLTSSATAFAGKDDGDNRGDGPRGVTAVRAATAAFHNIDAAKRAGYGPDPLIDINNIACIDNPAGGMGIHYVKGALVGNPAINATTPEVLVYEPLRKGKLRLVAVEYVVIKTAWHAANGYRRPSLFGQSFTLIPEGNRYGLPDFYELHLWIWEHNPSGMFDDWNPRVSCRYA
jgi:hypothetical protein